MSEHTPLTEAADLAWRDAWQEYARTLKGPPSWRQAFEAGYLAARTSTATAGQPSSMA